MSEAEYTCKDHNKKELGFPEEYRDRITWVKGILKTHFGVKCPECGKWEILVKREKPRP